MPRTVAPLSLSWPQVVGRRLARHHLLTAAPAEELVGVAGDICGVHCQMGVSAELMLGARVAGIIRSDVREALWERRTLVKTVGVRGTLHLFPADEVPIWMAANRLRFESEQRRLGKAAMALASCFGVVDATSDAGGPEPRTRPPLAAPGTAAPLAVLLVGGRVAGVWERRPKGRRLLVRVDAHQPLTRRQRNSVSEQAERAAQVLELQCELEFGPVPLRFHL